MSGAAPDEREARAQRAQTRFQVPLLVAALLTIPVTVIQLGDVGPPLPAIAEALNWLIWLVFLAEVVVMLLLVEHRLRWLRHNWLDVLIVVLTPPFVSYALQPARLFRLVRLVRLARLGPLFRYLVSKDGLRSVAVLVAAIAIAGAAAFSTVERYSFGNSLYWAVGTMTTVGSGSITPHTTDGKIVAVLLMLTGIGATSLLIGAITQSVVFNRAQSHANSGDDVLAQVQALSEQVQRLEATLERRASSSSSS